MSFLALGNFSLSDACVSSKWRIAGEMTNPRLRNPGEFPFTFLSELMQWFYSRGREDIKETDKFF